MSGADDEYHSIAVSPRHSVSVAADYHAFVARAPQRDFVVRTLAKKQAGGTLLMTGDLVIAGKEAREQFPRAAEYPLHFRKVYYPGKLHRDPQEEYDLQERASALLGSPPPIGATPNTFRSCLIPGEPYARLSPFGAEPEDSNIAIAQKLPLATAVGLWLLVVQAAGALLTLHEGGLVHGDTALANLVVCPAPVEALWIDFEAGAARDGEADEPWRKRCLNDLAPLLREAIFLQCRLGRQQSPLADLAFEQIDRLFKDPERFRRAVSDSGRLTHA